MAKPTLLLAALCVLIALSHASEHQGNDVISADPNTLRPDRTDLLIQLPTAQSEHPDEKQPDREARAELTTVTFHPADHKFDRSKPIPFSFRFPLRRGHGKPCRHGRRPLRPVEIPEGKDMIPSDENKGSGDLEGERPSRWIRFHHQGEGDSFEVNGMDRLHHHHHHHHHRFERDDDFEDEGYDHHDHDHDHDHHDHDHHHHHHHHHHHDHEAGFLGKIRKFFSHGF